jgi:DNA mismatch repair protein MutL
VLGKVTYRTDRAAVIVTRIQILPDILSNKIAAGEVVERPASVVKELIENAIDAGSTKIMVEMENGGRSLIRVSDNGIGMNHDDALLSLERYATSKIHDERDLFSIKTLGFRGEALPSIASVSRFTMTTRSRDSQTATEITVEGGKIKNVSEIGAPQGTMISVKQLFYNTPARRKFLKSATTEAGHVGETVSAVALGRPGIQFRLIHNNKTVKNWPQVESSLERALAVLGRDLERDLIRLESKAGRFSLDGWISSPAITRSTSQKIYIFVNGRYIKDRGLQHALFEGYRGRLMKGRFPVAVLFITLPFDRLDVNVHPAKHEVRFAEYQNLYEALKQSVFDAWDNAHRKSEKPVKTGKKIPGEPISLSSPDRYSTHNDSPDIYSPDRHPNSELQEVSEAVSDYGSDSIDIKQDAPFQKQPKAQMDLWKPEESEVLKVIGQVSNTYIVCESGDGIVLIDQHAAHERIVFEKLKQHSESGNRPVQHLLIPETIETNFKEAAILEKLIPDLKTFGLEIEPFGGNTFVVKSIPALIADREAKPLIMEILEKVGDTGFSEDLERTMDECLILMACHGALRANQSLSEREMNELLDKLDACENPSTCPHGRPIRIKWSFTELEKSFKRIV